MVRESESVKQYKKLQKKVRHWKVNQSLITGNLGGQPQTGVISSYSPRGEHEEITMITFDSQSGDSYTMSLTSIMGMTEVEND